MSAQRPVRLFVSYSHRDEKFLAELRKYLEVERHLDVWSDERIEAGAQWREEIRGALAQADAAILLVSQDFLASEFIRNHELPTLLESVKSRRLKLFLIPIGACTWRSAIIECFQWIHDPARPLRSLRPALREQALVDINQRIVEALIRKRRTQHGASELQSLSIGGSDTEQALRETLPSQYELRRQVASGTHAVVFEAHDTLLGRTVAIKAFRELELTEDPRLYEYYVRSPAGLKHRNICSVYSVQVQRLPNYVVTEFIDGDTLTRILAREARLPLNRALEYLSRIGDALEYAHERDLVHNRLRPNHIIVDPEGHPVISGFHAMLNAPSVGPKDRMTLEDQMYMSPEGRDGRPVSQASDQYLLGLLLYEMLAGEPLIAATSWGDLAAELTKVDKLPNLADTCNCANELAAVLARMLARDPASRYPSVATALADAWSISGARLNRRLGHNASALQAETARSSYRRALAAGDLPERIYHAFFATCTDAQRLFAKTDLNRQYDLLHHAIVLMLAFHGAPNGDEPTILSRVAARHGELGMRIPPEWFGAFGRAINQSIAAADPAYTDAARDAWHAVLDTGIRYMRSYAAPTRHDDESVNAAAG